MQYEAAIQGGLTALDTGIKLYGLFNSFSEISKAMAEDYNGTVVGFRDGSKRKSASQMFKSPAKRRKTITRGTKYRKRKWPAAYPRRTYKKYKRKAYKPKYKRRRKKTYRRRRY